MDKEQLGQKTFDLLEQTGLNWTVTQEPLVSAVDAKGTDSFGLYRKDTGAYLATVGKVYKAYQNFELAEALIQATEEVKLELTRGGQLRGGGRVYLQAELPEVYIGKSGMERYITGVNSHDGTSAIGFGSSGTVIVCENTWYMAYGNLSKFRHTATAQERILAFVSGMKQALSLDEKLLKTFRIMADTKPTDELVMNVLKRAFGMEDLNKPTSSLSSREKDKVTKISGALSTEYELEGQTVWGLFNAITRYTNHIAPARGKKPFTAERKLDYVMNGEGYETTLRGFTTIKQWLVEQGLVQDEQLVIVE